MARIVRLVSNFIAQVQSFNLSRASQAALGRCIRGLGNDQVLPGYQDYKTLIPPVRERWVRWVPGENLWVFYKFEPGIVTIVSVVRSPPIPADP